MFFETVRARTALCLLLSSFVGCATTGQGAPEPSLVGRDAPDFAASRLDGTPFQLSSLRGRVVIFDVWATWCEGCEKDLPGLNDIAARLGSLGVEVVAVSLDSNRESLLPLIASRTWRMTVIHDPTGQVGTLYRPSKMSAVFTIDRAGKIRQAHFGVTPDDLGAIEDEARALAK